MYFEYNSDVESYPIHTYTHTHTDRERERERERQRERCRHKSENNKNIIKDTNLRIFNITYYYI
jgi:hypothetical protein